MRRLFAVLLGFSAGFLFIVSTQAQESRLGPPPYGDFGPHIFPERDEPVLPLRPLYRREPRVIKRGLLAPPIEVQTAFQGFLQTKDTGLVRLLPSEIYDTGIPAKNKVKIRGGGAYYSFVNLTHQTGYGSDISLDRDTFSVLFYGLLSNIGDAPLAEIGLDDWRVQPLAAYRPPQRGAAAREDFRRLNSNEGLILDGAVFHRRAAVEVNSTYLLRSLVYRQSDVLVAFRVVGKDSDGSVVIVWKLLQRYPTPKLDLSNKS
jgi:hypothetical protein